MFTVIVGALADLWKYDGNWTFVGGTDKVDAEGVYSEPKVPDSNAYPSARAFSACWTDKKGHFWLHGGLFDTFGL